MSTAETIMVVEDDRDIRDSLSEVLADEGFEVLSAEDGRDALDRLSKSSKPRLILLDLMMPRMNGMQFREEQLKDPHIAQIPVVVLSAGANVQETAESIGAAGYLKKPVGIDELVATIQRVAGT